ncbi:MAG: SHOCT domain-containing protein [Actinobacteria bacterium]|nr:SHOCT domain-containing protein [Actinomycetota bacterium]
MMPFRRRRPVARLATTAAVGAVAYGAGKKHVQQQEINEQAQAAYAATQDMQQQQPAAPPPPAAAPAPPAATAVSDSTAELERLAQLHASGVLTDDEFSAAKAKVLGI